MISPDLLVSGIDYSQYANLESRGFDWGKSRFLKAVPLIVAASLIAACGGVQSTPADLNRPAPVAAPRPPTPTILATATIQESRGADFDEIKQLYPEATALRVKKDVIQTTNSRTTIYNFSEAQLNLGALQRLYQVIESMGSNDGRQFSSYTIGRNPVRFNRFLRAADRLLFIVPEDAPRPSFEIQSQPTDPQTENGRIIAYTNTVKGRDLSVVTIVSPSRALTTKNALTDHPALTDIQAATNKALATEACQATIDIEADNAQNTNLGQEIFCNSVGIAASTKAMQLNDARYQAAVRGTMNINGVHYGLIPFDRSPFPSEPFIQVR